MFSNGASDIISLFIFIAVSKTTRELILEWNKKNPVDLSTDLRMPQFTVSNVTTGNCAQDQTSMIGKTITFCSAFFLPIPFSCKKLLHIDNLTSTTLLLPRIEIKTNSQYTIVE